MEDFPFYDKAGPLSWENDEPYLSILVRGGGPALPAAALIGVIQALSCGGRGDVQHIHAVENSAFLRGIRCSIRLRPPLHRLQYYVIGMKQNMLLFNVLQIGENYLID